MNLNTTSHAVKLGKTFVDPVTTEVMKAFQLINFFILCGIISLFGIGSNILNICVFVKQGFKDSVNVSLLSLAVSDLGCSVTMFWAGICFSPLFQELDVPVEPSDVSYVSALLPHICFNRITSFITAFITLERCLCIAMPLKVKNIITPFRTKVINTLIFIAMIIIFSPFYFVQKLEWRFTASRNRSILVYSFSDKRGLVDSVTFFTHSVLLSTALLLTVAICTIILVGKLNEKTKWRSESAKTTSQQDTVSTKDKKVVKMITLIAAIFIVCYIPPTINFLIMTYNADFNITGRLHNTGYVVWSLTFVLEAFNSSVNIFVYYKMSSKFKDKFTELIFENCGGKQITVN